MQKGAFALIDCLGFKGIWKRIDNPDIIIRKLAKIEEVVQKEFDSNSRIIDFWGFKVISAKFNIRLLSDTVAISILEQESKDILVRQIFPSLWMNFCVINILNHFLKDDPHLVLRGCISYGEHISQGNFVVGPAVDEAAEYMNIADGAFVWMLPSASKKFMDNTDIMINRFIDKNVNFHDNEPKQVHVEEVKNLFKIFFTGSVVADYEMPIKGGGYLKCPVLNPILGHKTEEERQAVIEAYSKTMTGDKLDIWTKKQHTMKFLEVANENYIKFREVIGLLAERGFKPSSSNIETK